MLQCRNCTQYCVRSQYCHGCYCCLQVRLATSDLKQPIRETQGAAAQQAAALLKLSQQQAALQQQLDGSQELIAALQGLAAKQFKVCMQASLMCTCLREFGFIPPLVPQIQQITSPYFWGTTVLEWEAVGLCYC